MEARLKPDVLTNGQLAPAVMTVLEQNYTLHKLFEAADRQAFLRSVGGGIRAIATSNSYGVKAELMDACPKLELISSIGVGTDAIDVEAARERNIQVCNTPDVLNDDVANLAVALLLATTRNLVAYDRYVRESRWVRQGDPPLARGIAGKQIGMVGMGRIGQTIAEKLQVFGCTVAYFARNERTEVPYRYYPDLVGLARDSAALVVIVPGGRETERLVDRPVLDALGPEGILINVARGSVVDEPALVAALQEGRLGGGWPRCFLRRAERAGSPVRNGQCRPAATSGQPYRETRRAMADLMLEKFGGAFRRSGKLPTPRSEPGTARRWLRQRPPVPRAGATQLVPPAQHASVPPRRLS
jgi:hydroxypyruvate reductase 2